MHDAIGTTPGEAVPPITRLREDQKVPRPSPSHGVDRTHGVNQEGRPQLTFATCWHVHSLSPSPSKPAPGKQVLPARSTLLEFISICSFRLLSGIIVLLGLRAWEGRRCALLFINSLNACFKLKPTPHAGSQRNNIKTDCLPAFCY